MALYSDDAAGGVVQVHSGPATPGSIEEYESQGGLLSLPDSDESPSATENTPLLASGSRASKLPSGWLARLRAPSPYWVAVLAVCGSLSRSMVLAPRVEVYTTLACRALVPIHHTNSGTGANPSAGYGSLPVTFAQSSFTTLLGLSDPSLQVSPHVSGVFDEQPSDDDDDEPITTEPSKECMKNPAVNAAVARIQTIITLIMGVLSSFSTGLWGQFGDRWGRRPVILASSFGLMFVDIVFVLVSVPHSMFSGHGHKFLLVAPFVEGLLGGWSTFQAATNAYISDCTEHGSRARIFSRIGGIFYVGFAFGPVLGNLFVKLHPAHTTNQVFYLSIGLAMVNLFLVLFIVPESVAPEERQRRHELAAAAKEQKRLEGAGFWRSVRDSVSTFFAPLALFVPKTRGGEVHWSDYKDWNLTCLAIALFCYLLTVAVFQLKYVYARKLYLWDSVQLGYYISVMGGVRAIHLLFILPSIIRLFRRRSRRNVTLKQRSVSQAHVPPEDASEAGKDPAALSREIHFDLLVVKFSLALDFTSHLLVTVLAPKNGFAFTGITALSSMGAGLLPAVHSLALCILHASGESADVGKLFGALSVLQAVGSTILGPSVFGALFAASVGKWNEAIFCLAASLIFVAICMVSMVRSRKYVPEGTLAAVRAHRSHWLVEEDEVPSTETSATAPHVQPSTSRLSVPVPQTKESRRARGRSRRSKDLSGSFAEQARQLARQQGVEQQQQHV